ncbi:hypothetical protein MMC28_004748 [Mycoblastus sanguinarius]|nr:hypothetical protein [Mycoblastus sanguinarius]
MSAFSAKQPVILIIHGGYFLSTSWAPFIDLLSNAGFLVHCPRLPTCGDVRPLKATIQDDVIAVRSVALELASAGHAITVLAHSYGGMVASEAICEDLYAKGTAKGKGGVAHLIYLCAYLLQPGDSLRSTFERHGFQSSCDVGFNEDGTAVIKNAPDSFFNDIAPERALELAKETVTHNWAGTSYKVTGAPWKEIPTTFVYCEKDMAIFLDLQESMVKSAIESGANNLDTHTLGSGHCPFLSMPMEVVTILSKISTGLRGK